MFFFVCQNSLATLEYFFTGNFFIDFVICCRSSKQAESKETNEQCNMSGETKKVRLYFILPQRTRRACRVFVYCLNNAILVCNKECEANSSLYLFKTPSRSARRKKAKRQWLREKTKLEKEEVRLQILQNLK